MKKLYRDFRNARIVFLMSVLVGLIVGLLVVGKFAISQQDLVQIKSLNNLLYEQNQILKDEILDLYREDKQRMNYILKLSTEFNYDPRIVQAVDKYSRQYVDSSKQKWKLINTHQQMTHWMLSLIMVESVGNTRAVSSKQALGLTQLLINTARIYEPQVTREELFQPEINIRIAYQHFSHLLSRYQGNILLAFDAWNRGEGRVDRLQKAGLSTDNGFARKIYSVAVLNGYRN